MTSFKQVGVFTSRPFTGNPLAVVMDGSSLTVDEMQTIANWTNLSETTFVMPTTTTEADYRVRIFTPKSELPFAGHPTIGTCHALSEAGVITPKNGIVVQECGVGLVNLTVDATISFELPKASITPLEKVQIDTLENALGCSIDRNLTPLLVDVGARWIVARTTDAQTVLSTTPKFSELAEHNRLMMATGVCIYGERSDGIEVRSFGPAVGVNEDPVCGSGNGAVAAFIWHHERESKLLKSRQGSVLGRDGEISLKIGEKILVGGKAVTCVEGVITLKTED